VTDEQRIIEAFERKMAQGCEPKPWPFVEKARPIFKMPRVGPSPAGLTPGSHASIRGRHARAQHAGDWLAP
jgi:hypothetical protein